MGFLRSCVGRMSWLFLFHDEFRVYGFAPGRCVGFSLLHSPNEFAVLFHNVLRVYGFAPGRCVGFLCWVERIIWQFCFMGCCVCTVLLRVGV